MPAQTLAEGSFHGGTITVQQTAAGAAPETLHCPAAPFIAGIDLAQDSEDQAWLEALLRHLIRRGAVYLSFHGFNCEAAHDLADAIRDESAQEFDTILLTTWHPENEPTDFIRDIYLASPASAYVMKTTGVYVLLVGSGRQHDSTMQAIRQIFSIDSK